VCDQVVQVYAWTNKRCIDIHHDGTSFMYNWPNYYYYDDSSDCTEPYTSMKDLTNKTKSDCSAVTNGDDRVGDDMSVYSEAYVSYVRVINDNQWYPLKGGYIGATIVGSFFATVLVVGVLYCTINSRLQMNKQPAFSQAVPTTEMSKI
jgi:hypothetical protein